MFKFRVINHWDNMDGSVERGYAGRSLFFRDGKFCYDEQRIEHYAAQLQKIGVNAISLNNVNVDERASKLITPELLPDLAKIAAIFRRHGIRLLIAIEFSAPMSIIGQAGKLDTCDPLDERVQKWWNAQTDIVYGYIPDLLGFLVKADSEFRTGPAALGRTQADGANMLAKALLPHDGVVFWRCFVYNCMQDWRDTTIDRVAAAYNEFMPQDGKFDSNVILQIKNGPVDFQVREPLSPLLGNMKNTRQALELQITQEYTGQQIDLYNLAEAWEEIFAMPVNATEKLSDMCGSDEKIEALVGVANVGDDNFLCGNPLAECNLYAFGRFGANPKEVSENIVKDWVTERFGKPLPALESIINRSRAAYAGYTAPLGIGFMVAPHYHYAVSPEGYEFDRWGTYHKANHTHIGVERGSSGTNSVAQYDPYVAALYENPATTPDELQLFFHRLPYSYVLKSGKTILQHIYDSRFEGAEAVSRFIDEWQSLKNDVPEDVFIEVEKRLQRQLENAKEWRDVINTYFYRLTGIPDEKGRKIYD
jgi:alpha-glucuronidase